MFLLYITEMQFLCLLVQEIVYILYLPVFHLVQRFVLGTVMVIASPPHTAEEEATKHL